VGGVVIVETLFSLITTVLGWLPGAVLLAVGFSAAVAGFLSGGFARTATVLLTVAALAGWGGWQAHTWRTDNAARKAAEQQLQAEKAARTDELIRTRNAERTAHEQDARQRATLARARAAESAAQRLREQIAELNDRDLPPDPSAAAAAREARTARDLLGRCGEAYRRVDQRAQDLGDQVTGLLDFVETVCRAGK